jgi:hypothetical protein
MVYAESRSKDALLYTSVDVVWYAGCTHEPAETDVEAESFTSVLSV